MSYSGWILGDSFSEWHEDTWVGKMCREYNLKSFGLSATNNIEIWRSAKNLDSSLPAIINLSHPQRIGIKLSGVDDAMSAPNMKAAFNLRKRFKNSYIWTPFPGYEHYSWINEVTFPKNNDLYFANEDDCVFHYTPKGHELMFEHMSKQIDLILKEIKNVKTTS